MPKLIINWWKQLTGTVTPVPNKNSIIKLIPAALLTDETVAIHNVPTSSDVQYMCQIVEKLGWSVEWFNDNSSIRINCSWVHNYVIDAELSDKMKASVMFLWPLLIRFGKAEMPSPQWCKLWTRPLDVLIDNMIAMGADYKHENGNYSLSTTWLTWTEVRQRFPSVTWTENLIILAARTPGTTIIYNAACEPHTQDLCNMLVSMGAKINGIGSNRLEIQWVDRLSWTERTVVSDHLDVWGYIAAAAMTWGEVTIENACTQHMGMIVQMMDKLGVSVDVDHQNNRITVPKEQELIIKKTIKWNIRRTHALQRPLIPPDFVHVCVVVALKAEWQAVFDNLFYEYGFFFVQELAKMKANIVLANPTTVITSWPTDFKASESIVCSDIIQASYGLMLAALAAPWRSVLNAVTPLFRRFPDFVEKFTSLGAEMELVDE